MSHSTTHVWSTAAEHKDFPELENLFPSKLGTQGRWGARESNNRFCECGGGWNLAGNRPFWSPSIPFLQSCCVAWCVRNPLSMLGGQIYCLARLRPDHTLPIFTCYCHHIYAWWWLEVLKPIIDYLQATKHGHGATLQSLTHSPLAWTFVYSENAYQGKTCMSTDTVQHIITHHSISDVCMLHDEFFWRHWSLVSSGSSKGQTADYWNNMKQLVLESILSIMAVWVQCAQVFKHGCCVGGTRGCSNTETEGSLQYLFVSCESVIATNRWLTAVVQMMAHPNG